MSPMTRREFLSLVGLGAAGLAISACDRRSDIEKLENYNSVLAKKIAGWMGITANTTPEEYSELCFKKSFDPSFAIDVQEVGVLLGPNGTTTKLLLDESGECRWINYKASLDHTSFIRPSSPAEYVIYNKNVPNNNLIYFGTPDGTRRIIDNQKSLQNLANIYLSGTKMPYNLLLIATPGDMVVGRGSELSKRTNLPEGVTMINRTDDGKQFTYSTVVVFLEQVYQLAKNFEIPPVTSLAGTLANERVHLLTLENPNLFPEYLNKENIHNERFSTLAGLLAKISTKYDQVLFGGNIQDSLKILAKEMELSVQK